jgi:sugar phosphate isomerase/epimerase
LGSGEFSWEQEEFQAQLLERAVLPGLWQAGALVLAVTTKRRFLDTGRKRLLGAAPSRRWDKDTFWDYPEFAQQRDVFLELLDAIGPSPWFGVNFDPSNSIVAGEDPIELLEAVKDRVVTMHASDRYLAGGSLDDLHRLDAHPLRGYADILQHGVIGKGLNDYDRIFAILAEAGFRAWVSIEDGSDPEVGAHDIAESAKFLRAKMCAHGLA